MAGRISNQIVRNGLVLYLDAANTVSYTSGSTTWRDISGNGNNGTLTNGPTFSSANGGAIVFDGSNDFCLLPTNLIPYPSLATFTISLWFRSSQSNGGTLFGQQDTTNPSFATGWVPAIYLRSDGIVRVEPFWTGNTINSITTSTALNNNVWHNITTTYNSGTNQLYANGSYVTQQTGLSLTSYASTYYYIIGAGYSAGRSLGTDYFSGSISNFSFYNRALTATEVLQNYNALKGRYGL
jgi:hypothetical protein